MSTEPGQSPRLIAISISHYCEKARWALERLEIPYIEERHVPLFNRLATRKGGGQSVPLLVTAKGIYRDSTDILQYLDAIAPVSKKLYPEDPKRCREVKKLADLFDTQLGPHTRRWFYSYTLSQTKLMQRLFCDGVNPVERTLFPIVFPLIRQVMRRAMNITAESAGESRDRIERIFENANKRLADGRPYLVGDSFSAADLTFACLAAPVLFPAEYGVKVPQLQELPGEMAAQIEKLRETPAGMYALRLFREEREGRDRYSVVEP